MCWSLVAQSKLDCLTGSEGHWDFDCRQMSELEEAKM